MLQLLALLFGLCSWGILFLAIRKRKKWYSLSWFCCAIALYIPSLCQFLEFRVKDYASVIDCAATYHLLSAILLFGNLILTIIAFITGMKKQ